MEIQLLDIEELNLKEGDLIVLESYDIRLLVKDDEDSGFSKYALLDLYDGNICTYWYDTIEEIFKKFKIIRVIPSKKLKLIESNN